MYNGIPSATTALLITVPTAVNLAGTSATSASKDSTKIKILARAKTFSVASHSASNAT